MPGAVNTWTCQYCGDKFEGNFCTQCGKPKNVDRFTPSFLWRKLVDASDLGKLFFLSIIRLLINPGKNIREYLKGTTWILANPIKTCIILGAIATWIAIRFTVFGHGTDERTDTQILGFTLDKIDGYSKHSGQYFLFFSLTGIPIFSLISWLVYLRAQYNFIEHLVLNLFIAAGQFALFILYAPVLINLEGMVWMNVYGIINVGYNLWAMLAIFNKYKWNSSKSIIGCTYSLPDCILLQLSTLPVVSELFLGVFGCNFWLIFYNSNIFAA